MDYYTTDFLLDAFQERNSDCWPFSVLSYLTASEPRYSDARRKLSLNQFSLLTPATESFDGSLLIQKPLFIRKKRTAGH